MHIILLLFIIFALPIIGFVLLAEGNWILLLCGLILSLWLVVAAFQPYVIYKTTCEADTISTYNNGLVSQIRYYYNGTERIEKLNYYIPAGKYNIEFEDDECWYFGINFQGYVKRSVRIYTDRSKPESLMRGPA
jgi:hypothetical protein